MLFISCAALRCSFLQIRAAAKSGSTQQRRACVWLILMEKGSEYRYMGSEPGERRLWHHHALRIRLQLQLPYRDLRESRIRRSAVQVT